MSSLAVAPAGARCVRHPDSEARFVCPRCGGFMCAQCGDAGAAKLCPACVELVGGLRFPFTRDDHDFSRVWDWVYARWRPQAVMLGLSTFIFLVVGAVGSVASNVGSLIGGPLMERSPALGASVLGISLLLGLVINVVAQGFVQLGLYRICIDALSGKAVDVGALFGQSSKLRAYLAQIGIVIGASLVAIGSLVALIAGVTVVNAAVNGTTPQQAFEQPLLFGLTFAAVVGGALAVSYWLCPLVFAPMEIVFADASGWASIVRAMEIGEGHRIEIIGYALAGSGLVIGGVMLGLVTACLGLFVTVPASLSLFELLLVAKYLALRARVNSPAAHST